MANIYEEEKIDISEIKFEIDNETIKDKEKSDVEK